MNDYKIAKFKPKKTAARMKIIDEIVGSLNNEKVFKGVTVQNWKEKELSIQVNNFLRDGIKIIFEELYPDRSEKKSHKKLTRQSFGK